MKVKEIKNEGLVREYKITLPAGALNDKVEQRLKTVAKKIKMPGFRPGKVPLTLVKKKHGKEILGEILESEVSRSTKEVLDERKIIPALQPKIEISGSFNEGKDLEYSIALEVFPEVPEIELEKFAVEKPVVVVNSADIDDGMMRLRKAQREFKALTKQRAAKNGDIVIIDFVGKVKGVAFDGGAGTDVKLELGSNQFIPGYEDQLVGAKKGESRVVKVKFPKDYGSSELAGKDAEFDVDIKDIQEGKLPEVNDEFAKKLGFDSVAALRDGIKAQIERDFEGLAKIKLKKELFDKLSASVDFPVPEGMVDLEMQSLVGSGQAETVKKGSKEEKDYKDISIRRVKLGILLAELGGKFDIAVTEDELRRAVFEQARNYPGQEQRVIEIYQNNRQALDQLKGPILEEKVVAFILGKVKVTDKNISTKELIKFSESSED